ncbi:MAG: YdcF family protein [Oscillospiraceae bacterium]|nr:YdcF family protein [bacterium]MDY5100934.1 YdcF family protein [Oscillospiraceae bacterium]
MKRKIINDLILLLGVFCFVYYLGMGIFVRFGQSMLWLWPLGGTVCLVRYFLVRRSIRTGERVPLPRWFIVLWRVCLAAGFAFFFFVEYFVCAGAFEQAPAELDCVIVLGAKVNATAPSGALRQRIDAAAGYLEANPDTLCIASGGQGDDEGISEAQCIRDNLMALGIDGARIVLEDRSVDTYTNLQNSIPLLPEGTRTVGIVTSDFHVFRSLRTAAFQGWDYEFYGIPARSSRSGFLHYAVREFCAIVVSTLEGNL